MGVAWHTDGSDLGDVYSQDVATDGHVFTVSQPDGGGAYVATPPFPNAPSPVGAVKHWFVFRYRRVSGDGYLQARFATHDQFGGIVGKVELDLLENEWTTVLLEGPVQDDSIIAEIGEKPAPVGPEPGWLSPTVYEVDYMAVLSEMAPAAALTPIAPRFVAPEWAPVLGAAQHIDNPDMAPRLGWGEPFSWTVDPEFFISATGGRWRGPVDVEYAQVPIDQAAWTLTLDLQGSAVAITDGVIDLQLDQFSAEAYFPAGGRDSEPLAHIPPRGFVLIRLEARLLYGHPNQATARLQLYRDDALIEQSEAHPVADGEWHEIVLAAEAAGPAADEHRAEWMLFLQTDKALGLQPDQALGLPSARWQVRNIRVSLTDPTPAAEWGPQFDYPTLLAPPADHVIATGAAGPSPSGDSAFFYDGQAWEWRPQWRPWWGGGALGVQVAAGARNPQAVYGDANLLLELGDRAYALTLNGDRFTDRSETVDLRFKDAPAGLLPVKVTGFADDPAQIAEFLGLAFGEPTAGAIDIVDVTSTWRPVTRQKYGVPLGFATAAPELVEPDGVGATAARGEALAPLVTAPWPALAWGAGFARAPATTGPEVGVSFVDPFVIGGVDLPDISNWVGPSVEINLAPVGSKHDLVIDPPPPADITLGTSPGVSDIALTKVAPGRWQFTPPTSPVYLSAPDFRAKKYEAEHAFFQKFSLSEPHPYMGHWGASNNRYIVPWSGYTGDPYVEFSFNIEKSGLYDIMLIYMNRFGPPPPIEVTAEEGGPRSRLQPRPSPDDHWWPVPENKAMWWRSEALPIWRYDTEGALYQSNLFEAGQHKVRLTVPPLDDSDAGQLYIDCLEVRVQDPKPFGKGPTRLLVAPSDQLRFPIAWPGFQHLITFQGSSTAPVIGSAPGADDIEAKATSPSYTSWAFTPPTKEIWVTPSPNATGVMSLEVRPYSDLENDPGAHREAVAGTFDALLEAAAGVFEPREWVGTFTETERSLTRTVDEEDGWITENAASFAVNGGYVEIAALAAWNSPNTDIRTAYALSGVRFRPHEHPWVDTISITVLGDEATHGAGGDTWTQPVIRFYDAKMRLLEEVTTSSVEDNPWKLVGDGAMVELEATWPSGAAYARVGFSHTYAYEADANLVSRVDYVSVTV